MAKRRVKTIIRRARRVATGARASALSAASGGVAYLAHSALSKNISAVQTNWWIAPLVMAVGGHILKKKQRLGPVGDGLLGASGYALALGYQMSSASASVEKSSSSETDAGILLQPSDFASDAGDIGALMSGESYVDDSQNPYSRFYNAGELVGDDEDDENDEDDLVAEAAGL